MKEFGLSFSRAISGVKTFFGGEYTDLDKTKFSSVLNNTSFLEMPEDIGAALEENCVQADRLLERTQDSGLPIGEAISGVDVLTLGKPRQISRDAIQERMDQLSEQMGRMLVGYDEMMELSVLQSTGENGEYITRLRLGTEAKSGEKLSAMLRSVYGRADVREWDAPQDGACGAFKNAARQYGILSFPYVDPRLEHEKTAPERLQSNWVDAVLRTLPAGGEYRASVRVIPLASSGSSPDAQRRDLTDAVIDDRIAQLQLAADTLTLLSSEDWSTSSSIGANYGRQRNIISEAVKKISGVIKGRENVTGNYSATFGHTVHQRSKRAEELLKRIDRELYRLRQAKQSRGWRVEISVEAMDENVLLAVCAAMTGALKKDRCMLEWTDEHTCGAIALSRELLPLLRFPTQEFPGFEFVENEEFLLISPADESDGMNIGSLLWNGRETQRFFLPEQALNRHAFICGMTGAGKTNTLFKMLETVEVPFLVIEPVKGEYRSLASYYEDLRVWTMKADGQAAANLGILRINPFWFPENTSIPFHVDSIKTIIASAFEMSNAMPNILEQCMYNIYIKAGWNIITNRNRYAGTIPEAFLYPTFSDLLDEVEDYLDHSKFVGETLGDYHGAMTTRLKSFVNSYKGLLLNTQEHPDYGQMMRGRSVIELEGLADDADKCLVMGTVLVQYYEYLKLHFTTSDKRLQHILIIEEAHRLFKNVQKRSGGSSREGTGADPTGQLVESLSNIMAEIRAFGEGLLIVDQSPSKIAEDVIKNSGTKIIHRIDNENDIQLLQSALLLHGDKTSLPALSLGEALIRTEGMKRPCKVKLYESEIKESYQLSESFKGGEALDSDLENAFAAMAILSDDDLALELQNQLWSMLFSLADGGMENWQSAVDSLLMGMIRALTDRRRYDLVNGRMDVIRQIIAQMVRRMRSFSGKDIGVNELGAIHLFLQRLIDFYGNLNEGVPMKANNIRLFERYYDSKITSLLYEIKSAWQTSQTLGTQEM